MNSVTDLYHLAARVRAIVLDGDGVIFTGRALIGPAGEALKERSHIDGQGISLLRSAGVRFAFVSGEASGFLEALGNKLNALPSVQNGVWPPVAVLTNVQGHGKVEAVGAWLAECGVQWEDCAAMGDDISDAALLKKVGLPAAPQQAEDAVKRLSYFIAARRGGDGAIRDLCNFIMFAKGIDPAGLSLR